MARSRRKKFYKKSKKTYRKNKKKGTGKYSANSNMVVYMAPRQLPFAPRYRCKMTACIYGSQPAGVSSGHYYAKLNGAHLPLNGTWPTATVPPVASLNPTGYSAIINSTLYQNVRVYASKFEIEFLPQALTDTVEVTVTPSQTSANPATTQVAMAQENTKSMFMSSSKTNSKSGSAITNAIAVHKFIGVSNRAIEDDLSGNYDHTFNGDPFALLFWVVNWACPDGVITATPLEFRAKITIYLEAWNMTSATVTEA